MYRDLNHVQSKYYVLQYAENIELEYPIEYYGIVEAVGKYFFLNPPDETQLKKIKDTIFETRSKNDGAFNKKYLKYFVKKWSALVDEKPFQEILNRHIEYLIHDHPVEEDIC